MPTDSRRPSPAQRCFTSPYLETVITETSQKIADPELRWLFQNCLPNTLDTTVSFTERDASGRPDTFIITGDIDAMWLRDSTNQVWPYVQFANHCPKIKLLLQGLIHRQAACVLLDPYANAFYRDATKESQWKSDYTTMKPGVHERKYELDSLASVLRLATGYFEATQDPTPFDDQFFAALDLILQTITNEQAGTPEQINPWYSFGRVTANATDTLPGGGHGNPVKRTGLSRSPFRPSDDASVFQYHIPANAMAAVMLHRTAEMLVKLFPPRHGPVEKNITDLEARIKNVERQAKASKINLLSVQIKLGIEEKAAIQHPTYGWIYAYEIDGYDSHHFMDDANVPNLLSLAYLGYCGANDETYLNTRKFILSPNNPYFHSGLAGSGVGGPHIGLGWIWPLGIITQAITSTDDAEILACLKTLKDSNAGTGFIHEAFWKDNPAKFTRHWFAWANTFFGELILHLAQHRPHLLQQPIA